MVDLLTQNAVSTNTGNTYDPSIKDLNGEPGPQSQLSIPDASQAHIDSLQQVPGGASKSPFQDLNGEPDPLFNTLEGTSDSPFVPRGGTGDHMVDLLNSTVASTNTGQTYERSNQDLNITENGIGNITYFHGVANPGALDGLQLNGADLHEALLTDSYNYSYGITQGNYQANVEISQGGFDLDGGLPTNGKYTNPDTGVGF